MTNELDGVAGIHRYVHQLLAAFDRAAHQAGIEYFLAYGTALGAVRDGDLMGWDVDADVWLPREHYDTLGVGCGPRKLPEPFTLITPPAPLVLRIPVPTAEHQGRTARLPPRGHLPAGPCTGVCSGAVAPPQGGPRALRRLLRQAGGHRRQKLLLVAQAAGGSVAHLGGASRPQVMGRSLPFVGCRA